VDFELLLSVGLSHQEKHPDADVEFIAFEQQWLLYILLYNVGLRFDAFTVHSDANLKRSLAEKFAQLLQGGEDVNPTSSVERSWFQYPQLLARWLFSSHALAELHYPGQLLAGIPYLHEIIFDYKGLEFAGNCPLEVVVQEMRQALLNLRCILPKIHQVGYGYILANGIGVIPLEVAVKPILVRQFNLPFQVVENDGFASLLANIK
jgi:hypothetical protein